MKYFLIVIFVFGIGVRLFSQTVSPAVINSAGGGGQIGSSNLEVYYNIGEPIVSTALNSNNIITQGFLQPDIVGEFGLTASAFVTPNSCADKTDGVIKISASISGAANQSDFQLSYYWSPSSYCSSVNTCSVISSLPAGTYSVMVVSHYIGSGNALPDDTVSISNLTVSGSTEPCQISVYNGITPNGDGQNDFFAIDNIENFPDNRVDIYNRWGQKLAGFDNYSNTNNYWNGTIHGTEQLAPSGTYFYVIELKNGSKPIKGWIELTSNK
ncbi:MAG: gliding motility-associated C-terminal domain-containing protein [Bacteroidetes bacterium]|nr:gliding motility-associated C-terminal domain-containing protein [Bacteroidota bacterium]